MELIGQHPHKFYERVGRPRTLEQRVHQDRIPVQGEAYLVQIPWELNPLLLPDIADVR